MKVKRDQITGIILALAGVGIIFMSGRLKAEMSFSYPGAKFLPLFSAAGMIF